MLQTATEAPVSLPLEPSWGLSKLVACLHILVLALFTALFVPPFAPSGAIPLCFFLPALLLLLLSLLLWLLRHCAMLGFCLVYTPSDASRFKSSPSAQRPFPQVLLQGRHQQSIHSPVAKLRWQHPQLLIWQVKVSSRWLGQQLSVAQRYRELEEDPAVDNTRSRAWAFYIASWSQRLLHLLPLGHLNWYLLLWRPAHDAHAWRRFYQRLATGCTDD